jgi:hypothetical protein
VPAVAGKFLAKSGKQFCYSFFKTVLYGGGQMWAVFQRLDPGLALRMRLFPDSHSGQ